jgi:N-formylglutamate deformylase
VIIPVSRLVCDVERFPSDADEPMAARGMGVIYTRTSMGSVLRAQPDAADRQSLLDRLYWPHHVKLERMVNEVVVLAGTAGPAWKSGQQSGGSRPNWRTLRPSN